MHATDADVRSTAPPAAFRDLQSCHLLCGRGPSPAAPAPRARRDTACGVRGACASLACAAQMATLPSANALLEELRVASRPAAEKDLQEVQAFAKEQGFAEDLKWCVRLLWGWGLGRAAPMTPPRDLTWCVRLCGGGWAGRYLRRARLACSPGLVRVHERGPRSPPSLRPDAGADCLCCAAAESSPVRGCVGACRWDVSFWAERLREARYSINEEELRPYFALPNVSHGALGVRPGRSQAQPQHAPRCPADRSVPVLGS